MKLIFFRKVREETYFGYDSYGGLFMSLIKTLLISGAIALAVLLGTGFPILGISFLLHWLDIEFLAEKIVTLPEIFAGIAFLISCVLFGAYEGVQGHKRYLESMSHEENEENMENGL